MKRVTAAVLAGVSLAALGGVAAFRAGFHADEPPQAAASSAPSIGGPFTLTNQNSSSFSSSALAGSMFLIGFGYTSCPDICPTMLQTMTEVMEGLNEKERAQFRPVFVSVDGTRDTPDVLRAYLEHFHPGIVGLTGSKEETAAVAKAYRAYYKLHEPDASGNYMVDHGGSMYLMGKDGQFLKSFSHATPQASMVTAIREALTL